MERLKETVQQIEAITRKPGFIYTLALILLRDMFVAPEQAADINWRDRLSFQELTFLVGLLIKHEIDLDVPAEEESAKTFESVYNLFHTLHLKHNEPFFEQLEQKSQKNPKEDYRKVFGNAELMTESIFYGASGTYDFQYLEFARDKYRQDQDWIRAYSGLQIQEMASVANKLKEFIENKLVRLKKNPPPSFSEICSEALDVLCFRSIDLSGISAQQVGAFLRAFSVKPGQANQALLVPGQYNELESHPIVQLPTDQYFLPIGFNVAQSIYESPFYWMTADTSYSSKASKHRGDFAEDIVARLLRKVFGEGNVYTNVKVKNNRSTTVTDIDALSFAGNKAVIVQVKSKRLTELSKTGNDEKLAQDFKSAVQDAYDQALSSRKAIIDRTNKLFVDNKELVLKEKLDDAYILCVTLDHYPAIAHQVDVFLKRNETDPFPICLSVFDLDVLACYLSDPFEFLYYLRQRTTLSDYFKANSELTFLAYHLRHKLILPPKPRPNVQVLDNTFAGLIDGNFPVLRMADERTKGTEKLHPGWQNPGFHEPVAQVKSSRQAGLTDAIFFLYDIAGASADKLIETLKLLLDKTRADGKSHDASMAFLEEKRGITVVSGSSSGDFLEQKVIALAKAKKYKDRADSWLAFGTLVDSPNLIDVVAFNKEPWKEDKDLGELSGTLLQRRGTLLSGGSNKIGRNELCPCGSGKKFKKCHSI